ncbi:blue copper protein 1a-like [Andrographis paniculata]|uniref:blue copper protein 1a-like n=1 Tax=Andrographis paniculata TaxID=175694 RepID=UPI0021E84340|nr:blue copper protein 1a-like [Andrographis paniculata]
MASITFLVSIIIAVAIAPTMAVDYMVGDDAGWKVGVNYTQWAAGKDFRVGDTLMFMYTEGKHNVYKVNGSDFQNCNPSTSLGGPLTSGKDSITLAKPGKKWYICGVADHCSKGMKLVITVSDASAPAPAPIPGTPAPGTSSADKIARSFMWIVAGAIAYSMLLA